jgi:hypothetical protein
VKEVPDVEKELQLSAKEDFTFNGTKKSINKRKNYDGKSRVKLF